MSLIKKYIHFLYIFTVEGEKKYFCTTFGLNIFVFTHFLDLLIFLEVLEYVNCWFCFFVQKNIFKEYLCQILIN